MEFGQGMWCLGYSGDNCVADSLGEWGSVEGRVGDNIEGMLVMEWCSLGGMNCLKEKEGIGGRVVGRDEDVRLDWCTERFVHIEKCLVVGLLSERSLCRWVGRIWLWLGIESVGEKLGVVIGCDAPPFAKGRTPVLLCHSLDQ
jgi:hypothetical protein